MISVLLPTRGRVPLLHTILTTLYTTVSDRRNVEVIARCDVDDQPTLDYLRQTAGVKIVRGVRLGYAQNARMVNQCAVESTGNLLLVANDDLEFQTTGWDLKLEAIAASYPDQIFDLGVDTVLNNENFCFPCISRRTMEVLGCFFDERLLYPDIWLRDIMMAFGRAVHVPEVVIKHVWAGQSEDQIRAGAQVHGNAAYMELYDRCLIEGTPENSDGTDGGNRMIAVCFPVLKRYDLLRGALLSLRAGTVQPDRVCIIDNGRQEDQVRAALHEALDREKTRLDVFLPNVPMGVAQSWNWFIDRIPEERIIANDDVVFGSRSLEIIVAAKSDLVWASGFSCFLIRDACIAKLGKFDETISPGYGYYEDDDYLQRLDGRGTRERVVSAENADAGVVHLKSQTLIASTHAERVDHHRKMLLARANYIKKWPHVAKEFEAVV